MAKIDYDQIETEIENVISNNVNDVKILKEEELVFGFDNDRVVGIYLQSRRAPANRQRLANGSRSDLLVSFLLRCLGFSIDGTNNAASKRNNLVGDIEDALIRNRDLNGEVEFLFLNGGDVIPPFQEGSGFASVGDVQIEVADRITT